jgi:fermentation-respiration switch protein FrsA (DUF1100 family)
MHLVRNALLIFLGVLAVFASLQRQMMYPAMRAESLDASAFPQLTQTFHAATDVVLTTPDNVKIRGWYLQAAAEKSDRLILLFHGNGGHRAHRGNWYMIAKSLNADVLAVDYHGYGDSEGSPSEAALISDAHVAWKHAVEELKYEPSQIVIVGESLGGGVAVQLAAEKCGDETPPAGIVLCATFASMLETASNRFRWLPVRFVLLDRYRSDRHIGNVTCPILQFHGDQDTLIPLFMGKRLHDLAPEKSLSGKPKLLHVLKGAGHNDVFPLHGRAVRDHMEKFIR